MNSIPAKSLRAFGILLMLASGVASAQEPVDKLLDALIPDSATLVAKADPTVRLSDLAKLPLQSLGFDGFVDGTDPGESLNRTDFLKLFGAFVDPRMILDDGDGNIKLEHSISDWVAMTALFQAPELRDAVKDSLDDAAESEALDRFDLFDDMTAQVTVRIGTTDIQDQMVSVLTSVMAAEIARVGGADLRASFQARLLEDPAFDKIWRAYQANQNKENTEAVQLYRTTHAAEFEDDLDRTIWMVKAEKLAPLYRAFQNRLQFQASAAVRSVEALLGQDSRSASVTAQWGFPRLPASVKDLDTATNWLTTHGSSVSKHPHSFAAELSYTDLDPIEGQSDPNFDLGGFRELTGAVNWSTKLGSHSFIQTGEGVGADVSLSVRYMRPNEDFTNEQLVINETVTVHITETIKLPLSLTYVNRQELIDEDDVRGHIGISYSFQGLSRK